MADSLEFDDSEAIKYILKQLSAESKTRVGEDDVQYVLDLICDYYDKNNLMDDDADEEASIAEDDMHNYIWSAMCKEKISKITEDDMQAILDGEFEYGKSIGIYTEGE